MAGTRAASFHIIKLKNDISSNRKPTSCRDLQKVSCHTLASLKIMPAVSVTSLRRLKWPILSTEDLQSCKANQALNCSCRREHFTPLD